MFFFVFLSIGFSLYISGTDQVAVDFVDFIIDFIENESTNGCSHVGYSNNLHDTNNIVSHVGYSNNLHDTNNIVSRLQNLNSSYFTNTFLLFNSFFNLINYGSLVAPTVIDSLPTVVDSLPTVVDSLPTVVDYSNNLNVTNNIVSRLQNLNSSYSNTFLLFNSFFNLINYGSLVAPTVVDSLPTVIDSLPTVVENVPTVVDMLPTVVDMLPTVVDMLPTVVDMLPTVVENVPTVVENVPIFNPDVCFFFRKASGFYIDPTLVNFTKSSLDITFNHYESAYWKSFINILPGTKIPLNIYEQAALVNFILPDAWLTDNIYHELVVEFTHSAVNQIPLNYDAVNLDFNDDLLELKNYFLMNTPSYYYY